MATQLIGSIGTQYTHSIATAQTGINVESFSVSVEPEFREDLLDYTGHVTGQAVGCEMTTLTITGETIRSTDGSFLGLLLDDDFASDATGTLTTTTNLAPNSGVEAEFVLQSSEVTQTRGAFETCTVTYIARTGLVVT